MAQGTATTETQAPFRRGDRALLFEPDLEGGPSRRQLVVLDGEAQKVGGLGVLDTARLEGLAPGAAYQIGSRRFWVLRPSPLDLVETVRRKAQIVLPKDAAQIVFQAGIGPGARVVEAGIGSAALTVALASAVGSEGRVFNYEVRQDFQDFGRANLERAGLLGRVELRLADPSDGIAEREVDAAVFDLPEPWAVVPAALEALRAGGTFAAYTPSVQQMERTVRALRAAGLADVHAEEVLVRRWHVGEKGVRPEFEMLGHTAWLTFGRKTGTA